MAYNKLLHEIMTSYKWMITDVAYERYAAKIGRNIDERTPLLAIDFGEKKENYFVTLDSAHRVIETSAAVLQPSAPVLQPSAEGSDPSLTPSTAPAPVTDDPSSVEVSTPTALVLNIDGPVMRNGYACAYGSRKMRDLMLQAAEDDTCQGVIICVNTPGGVCDALPDFRMGFEALRNAGKRTIALVDGEACSMGIAITCQADYVLATNPDDTVGCVGTMIRGLGAPDGAVTKDGERFINIVASQSPDKNRAIREAMAGDYTLLQQECDEACEEFHNLLRTCRPNVKPEHMTGKTYKASEAMGSLCDGIGTFDDCLAYILDGTIPASVPSASPSGSTAPVPSASPSGSTAPVPSGSAAGSHSSTQNINNNMNIQNICAALGINAEDLHVEEAGFFLNEAHVDTLDSAIATATENATALATAQAALTAANEQLATANEQLTAANARIAELEANLAASATSTDTETAEQLATAQADLAAANEQLATAQADLATAQAALTAANEQVTVLGNSVAEHEASIATANEQLATANARIAELEAENEALASTSAPAAKPAPAAVAGAATATNGKKAYRDCDTLDEKKANSIYA